MAMKSSASKRRWRRRKQPLVIGSERFRQFLLEPLNAIKRVEEKRKKQRLEKLRFEMESFSEFKKGFDWEYSCETYDLLLKTGQLNKLFDVVCKLLQTRGWIIVLLQSPSSKNLLTFAINSPNDFLSEDGYPVWGARYESNGIFDSMIADRVSIYHPKLDYYSTRISRQYRCHLVPNSFINDLYISPSKFQRTTITRHFHETKQILNCEEFWPKSLPTNHWNGLKMNFNDEIFCQHCYSLEKIYSVILRRLFIKKMYIPIPIIHLMLTYVQILPY